MPRPVYDVIVNDVMESADLITDPMNEHKYLFVNQYIDIRSLPILTLVRSVGGILAAAINENQSIKKHVTTSF